MSIPTLQGAVYNRLRTGIVSGKVADRIYADDFAPSNTTLPFIVFEIDRTESDADLGGTISWAAADLTVVCFDNDSHDVQELAVDVRRDLQDWQDDTMAPPIEWTLYQETINGVVEATRSEKRRYRVEVNFRIRFRDHVAADL